MLCLEKETITIGTKVFYVESADTFFSRLTGLMFRKSYDTDKALHITPCNSIHMFFMRFPITVVFVNKENYVLKVVENMKPWKMAFCFKAHGVYEYMTKGNEEFVPKIGEKVLSSSQFF